MQFKVSHGIFQSLPGKAKESGPMMLWAADNQPCAWASSTYSFYITQLFVFLTLCFVIALYVVIIWCQSNTQNYKIENLVNSRSSQFLTRLCTHVCRFVPMYVSSYIEKERKYNITHDVSFLKIYPNLSVYIRVHCIHIVAYISCYIKITPNAADSTFPDLSSWTPASSRSTSWVLWERRIYWIIFFQWCHDSTFGFLYLSI